jgi:hypothetical protein
MNDDELWAAFVTYYPQFREMHYSEEDRDNRVWPVYLKWKESFLDQPEPELAYKIRTGKEVK